MRLKRENAIACIIDVQEKFIPHIHESALLLKNTGTIIQGLQALDIPVILTEQNPSKLGNTMPDLKNLIKDYQPVEKMCFSCVEHLPFEQQLAASGRRQVILAGIETHICVLQTALDLIHSGYQVFVVEDCVSSRKEYTKTNALERMRQAGAVITCYESVLFELCGIAGTDEFRAVSALVK